MTSVCFIKIALEQNGLSKAKTVYSVRFKRIEHFTAKIGRPITYDVHKWVPQPTSQYKYKGRLPVTF